jgi:hypothetical protein
MFAGQNVLGVFAGQAVPSDLAKVTVDSGLRPTPRTESSVSNDRYVRRRMTLSDVAQDAETAHAWHLDVEKDEIVGACRDS